MLPTAAVPPTPPSNMPELRPPGTLEDWEKAVRPQDVALAQSHPRYGERLTDAVFQQLCEQGFAVVESYLPEEQRREMASAQRRLQPPLDQLVAEADGQPTPGQINTMFPYAEHTLNHAISNDPEALAFSARWLGTCDIHYRPGLAMSRYPLNPGTCSRELESENWADAAKGAHIDNGNNSLLPPTLDRRHSQIIFWFAIEDVAEDQGPTVMWPTRMTADGPVADMDSPLPFVAPRGSLCIFHNYTMHAASIYRRGDGQRYIWKHACALQHARLPRCLTANAERRTTRGPSGLRVGGHCAFHKCRK
jgi:hypothetical protein